MEPPGSARIRVHTVSREDKRSFCGCPYTQAAVDRKGKEEMLFAEPHVQDCRAVGYKVCLELRDEELPYVASKPKNALFLRITWSSPHSQGTVPGRNSWGSGGFVA